MEEQGKRKAEEVVGEEDGWGRSGKEEKEEEQVRKEGLEEEEGKEDEQSGEEIEKEQKELNMARLVKGGMGRGKKVKLKG